MNGLPLRTRARRLTPRLIGWSFGSAWGLLATLALPREGRLLEIAALVLTALGFLLRLWTRAPAVLPGASLFRAPAYLVAVVLEGTAIAVASVALPSFGGVEYLYSTIGLIVGLHFIGLWSATGSRYLLSVSAAMCVVSTLSMMMPMTWRMLDLRYAFLGVGNALTLLWGASEGR